MPASGRLLPALLLAPGRLSLRLFPPAWYELGKWKKSDGQMSRGVENAIENKNVHAAKVIQPCCFPAVKFEAAAILMMMRHSKSPLCTHSGP